MTAISGFVDRIVSPNKPHSIVTRYGPALALPLASVVITQFLLPLDWLPFPPLLVFSIVCAAIIGGIQPGMVATAASVLLNVAVLRTAITLRFSHLEDLIYIFLFVIAGVVISLAVGSVGALMRKVAIEHRRLEVTLSCIGDAVVSTDLKGRIVFMNPIAEQLTGWSSADALGKAADVIFRIINQRTRRTVESPIRKVLDLGESTVLATHTMLVRRDGHEVSISDSAAPIRNAEGLLVGMVMVFRDISIHEEREAALMQSQRLASVGRLAATIAHELNNPLQAASNLLFLISLGGDSKVLQKFGAEAAQELKRASDIAKQSLSFARDSGERESVSVDQLFDEVISLNRNKLKNKNIVVQRRSPSDLAVNARTGEIGQVLGNLVGNALDALDANGRLYLRAKPMESSGRSGVQFVVADNGSGMSEEHLARIFEPFFTTKKNVGTGLGLWVVKKIMDKEGGFVQIRSRLGRGTVARLDWPSCRPDDALAEPIPA